MDFSNEMFKFREIQGISGEFEDGNVSSPFSVSLDNGKLGSDI